MIERISVPEEYLGQFVSEIKVLYKSESICYQIVQTSGNPSSQLHSTTFDFLRDTFVILQICKVFLFLTRDKNNKSTLQIYGTCRRSRFVKYFYFHVAVVQIVTSREFHPQIWYKATSKRTFTRVHLSTLTSTLRTLLSQLSSKSS